MLQTTEKKKKNKAAAKSLLKHITQGLLLEAALAFFPLFGASKMNGRIMSKIEISIQNSGNLITLGTALHNNCYIQGLAFVGLQKRFS